MDMSVKLNHAYSPQVTVLNAAAANAQPKAESIEAGRIPQRDELEKAVTDIREFVQSTQRNLDFSIDDSTGVVVVKVIATDSGEVIRQLPSEAALKLAQSLTNANSLLFESKA